LTQNRATKKGRHVTHPVTGYFQTVNLVKRTHWRMNYWIWASRLKAIGAWENG